MKKEKNGFFPSKEEVSRSINSFNNWQISIFLIFLVGMIASAFLLLDKINNKFLIERPIEGGAFVEGVIGSPRFINPVLANSQTDKDLSALIFSGLMKKNQDGTLEKDLAENYEISSDGMTYVFTLRDDAFFHDNKKVTPDDILFTITNIQDGRLKSPVQAQWENISIKKIDEKTIEFKLPEVRKTFLENSSIGILPSHLWQDLDTDDFIFSDKNIHAIGSGPYKISKITQKKNGLIESVSLKPFKNHYSKKPYISNIKFKFYKNEEDLLNAFNKNKIDQINAISPFTARSLSEKGHKIVNVNLSRIFGVFLNSNKQEIFRNKNIVRAINLAINKEKIVEEVLGGYGKTIDSPIPAHLYQRAGETEEVSMEERIIEANSILEKEGWRMGEDGMRTKDEKVLAFSISTGDANELKSVVQQIKEDLQKIGIAVEIKIFEINNLNQNIIRPRDYESLFFGQIISNESDLFAFWHSSQRSDPGLNIASYTNSRVDGLLDKVSRGTDSEEKLKNLKEIEDEILKDMPAIFIYSPDFIYVTNEKIKNIKLENMIFPSERILNIDDWYIRTEKIWKFLIK